MTPTASRCPVCGGRGTPYAQATDIEYFTTTDVFDYLLCADCDLLYIQPIPSDRLGEIYPSNYYSFADTNKKGIVTRLKEWLDQRAFRTFLERLPGNSLHVLDVGGGNGWLAGLIRAIDSRVKKTWIVDIDVAARAVAESNGHQFFCGPIEHFSTTDRFHAILMLNLIEHVADPVAVLRQAKGLLAPGGLIYIKTPNFRALDARLFKDRRWGGYHCPRHFVLFTRESFEIAARKAGLSIVGFHYTQGAPFWSVSLLEMMRGWGLVSVSADRPAIRHPVMPLLQAASAIFDFGRKPFSRLSQMVVFLEQSP
jgi:SAM-dependent methyltransferase